MMQKSGIFLSKLLSVVFHPLLIPTYALVIMFNSNTHYSYMPFEVQKLLYILVFSSTFLVPVSIIPFLINLRVVSSFKLEKSKERIIPLTITALSFYFSYYIILASFILILISLFISIKWKISAHLIGLGGLLASMFFYAVYFVANFNIVLIVISIISGLVAFSRLNLQVHSPAQVYTGFLTGFTGMWIVLYFGL
jgi:hypothetical protein